MKLSEIPLGTPRLIAHIGGKGSFRRRLMELGLLPGTRVELVGVAPLGDPLELLVRGASLSIRRSDAEIVEVAPVDATSDSLARTPELTAEHGVSGCARGAR